MQILLLADTHVRDERRRLPDAALRLAERADLVLHAGDVVSAEFLASLEAIAPTMAVLGNNDHELVSRLPARLSVLLDGVEVAMVHDAGARAGRAARLGRWFPTAALVVFGHSHEPVDVTEQGHPRSFNPGSPIERRRALHHTVGWLEVADGQVVDLRHVVVS